MIVGRNSVADNFPQNSSVTRARVFQILKCEDRSPFTKNHSGPIAIEWPAFFRRGRLQRIEAHKDEFGKGVVSTGQHPLIFS